MNFNLNLPSFDGFSDSSAIQQLRGYLSLLNDQLRYLMINIDEENLSSSFKESLDTTSQNAAYAKNKADYLGESLSQVLPVTDTLSLDDSSRLVLSNALSGLKVNGTITLADENSEKYISLDDMGCMIFKTRQSSLPFCLDLSKNNDNYVLTVYGKNGVIAGKIPLTV